ncbi:FAD-dependent oxidoreductase, partial [bacterium]|nr:FAD-dependent oxidoreductase [bacterium]
IPGIYDKDPECEPSTGKTVGIVGSGPAGLTAAWFLCKRGHKPVIYESQPRSGGMVRYGIPEYRLPDAVLDAEVNYILRAGAEIKYNTKIGKDISLDELLKKHDSVFIGAGAQVGKPMRVEGENNTKGVVRGAEFLRDKADNHEPVSGTVVVVGGGNTAMDVARTSWRLGAEKVIILYRRTRAEMPADDMEIEDCLEEGIELMELASPVGIVKEDGRITALSCIRMKLGEPDDSGRRRPIPLKGSEFDLPCQLAVPAIGQSSELEGLIVAGDEEISTTKWGTFDIDKKTMETSVKGLFAGGDVTDDGATVVIDAIGDGRKAANAIHAYLMGEPIPSEDFRVRKEFWKKPGKTELGDITESPRHKIHTIDVEQRIGNFKEVATGFDYEDNIHECDRCLSCGCLEYDNCALRLHAQEYDVDMEEFKGYVRKHKIDNRHPYIVYDPNKCVLCTRCIRTCARIIPTAALGLIGRGFKTEVRPAMNDPLLETSCVSCGNCVDSCPTGALTIKYPFPGRASLYTEDVESHCAFCSLACPITVSKIGEKRYFIGSSGVPGDYLCRYGRFGYEIFVKKKRIENPELRGVNAAKDVDIDTALRMLVSGMKKAAEEFGPDKVGVFVSPDLTNEELYLAAKVAREGLETNNVASLSILAGKEKAGVLDEAFGFTGSTSNRQCVKDADLVICNNTSLESDHLILSADIIQAVKNGAKLIVSNSTLNATDQLISVLAMDPMRGRAAILWAGVINALQNKGLFEPDTIKDISDPDGFAEGEDFDFEKVSDLTGVAMDTVFKAADLIASAKKVVIVHCPDRPQDSAPGDMEILSDLVVLLRRVGVEADLLLPRGSANGAGIEMMGADPSFAPGRLAVKGKLAGASNREQLRAILKEGKIKAAFIIGEDPVAWKKTEAWFRNVEFMAVMDWTPTETTRSADVVLPGSTFLETGGSRCNFEGNLIEYKRAVEPPAGMSGREILFELTRSFGLNLKEDTSSEINDIIEENLDKALVPFCWNTGQSRASLPQSKLIKVQTGVVEGSIPPSLTQHEKYKREIINVGSEHYRTS